MTRSPNCAFFARQVIMLYALVVALACAAPPASPPSSPATVGPAAPTAPAASAAAAAPRATPVPVSLKVAYGTLSGNTTPIWLGKDRGLYEAEGLDVELVYLASSSQVAQGMISGEIPLAATAGAGAVDANLAGGDLVLISGYSNYISLRLWGGPSVERVDQLRGRSVGIVRLGSGSDLAARLILERNGLVGGQDVTLLQLNSDPDILNATTQGAVDAGVLAFPASYEAERRGLHLLDDTYRYRLPYIAGSVITTRSYLAAQSDVVRRFMRALLASLALYYCDREAAKQSIATWSRLDDPDVVEKTYQTFADLFERVPVPPASGLQTVLDQRASETAAARTANPAEWVDDRFVRELEASGYINRVNQCAGGTPARP
jgi:NitT/TauT family transport system substrate-binding protein